MRIFETPDRFAIALTPIVSNPLSAMISLTVSSKRFSVASRFLSATIIDNVTNQEQRYVTD